MALSEMFGVRLPTALTRTVAGLETLGPALAAALPFAAIAVGVFAFMEHLKKAREEAEQLKESQVNFGTVVENVYTGLDNKLLEAGIRADELNNDHLAALNKQLTLIDHQSLAELVHAFDEMGKAADLTFAQLKTSWYQFGSGSEGAKHALTDFKAQYDSLLAQGKSGEASDLLAGTRHSAEKVLELQKQAQSNQLVTGKTGPHTDYSKFEAASNALKAQGIGFTQKEIEAQQTLVDALRAQVDVEAKVQALKKAQDTNAQTETGNKIGADEDKLYRAQADAQRKAIDDQDKMDDAAYTQAVERIQQAEREKIEATDKGSAERLKAIDAAIQDENAHGLQETSMYKSLLADRIATAKQMMDEQDKLQAEAGKEAAEHSLRMAGMQIAAEKENAQLRLSAKHATDAERVAAEEKVANQEYIVQRAALSQQINALDQHGMEYENKLKALQNKQEQLTKQHEDKITAIKTQAEIQRNQRILTAEQHLTDTIASGLTKSITGQETWGKMMNAIGSQVVSGMLDNAIKSIAMDDMTKPHDAARAARDFFKAGAKFPFPANIVMAPALAAMAFATVMAFEGGGIVPGVENGDVVPARLTPGEAILPKQLTEHLTNAAKFGRTGDSSGDVHVHVTHHSTVHALDSDGMERVLSKHSHAIAKHVNNHFRRMNKR